MTYDVKMGRNQVTYDVKMGRDATAERCCLNWPRLTF